MKRILALFVAPIAAIVAVLGFVAAWRVLGFTHFLVTDGVGDAREMRGDGAQPEYWRDFVGYHLLLYILGLLIAIVSGAFATVAASLLRHGLYGSQRPSNQAEHVVGGNGG
jgi:hypothetical protein